MAVFLANTKKCLQTQYKYNMDNCTSHELIAYVRSQALPAEALRLSGILERYERITLPSINVLTHPLRYERARITQRRIRHSLYRAADYGHKRTG